MTSRSIYRVILRSTHSFAYGELDYCALYMLYKQCHGFYNYTAVVNARSMFQEHHLVSKMCLFLNNKRCLFIVFNVLFLYKYASFLQPLIRECGSTPYVGFVGILNGRALPVYKSEKTKTLVSHWSPLLEGYSRSHGSLGLIQSQPSRQKSPKTSPKCPTRDR